MVSRRSDTVAIAVLAFLVLLGATLSVYTAFWLVDFWPTAHPQAPLELMSQPDTAQTFSGLGEVTVAILGIAITVAAIIVELAANRYTPRITELFVNDPVNIAVNSFMVVTAVTVLWVEMSLYGDTYPATMVIGATAMMSISLFMVLPYFAYVFAFLSPTSIVDRIQGHTIDAIRAVSRGRGGDIQAARRQVLTGADQLGDIALNSVEQKDKAISIATVSALAGIIEESLNSKDGLPKEWFDTGNLAEDDPDFVAFHPAIVQALRDRRTWLEMKILRQFQTIFSESLHVLRDVNHLVSIRTVQVAVAAARVKDHHALTLTMRFINTFMRATLNARDVRTAYNLFNDVRILAEELLLCQLEDRALEVADRMKFYGQLAFNMGLPFIQETAAYDLCALIERADALEAGCQDDLLSVFLELDRQPDREVAAQEASLRGVRKAQVKLATYYLTRDDTDRARRIFLDMKNEPAQRMRSIREELQSILDPEYWEVSDRGINFDFLPPEQREQLAVFFSWFEDAWDQ